MNGHRSRDVCKINEHIGRDVYNANRYNIACEDVYKMQGYIKCYNIDPVPLYSHQIQVM